MNIFYSTIFSCLLFSCGTRVHFIGESWKPTDKIEVFTNPLSIAKPYKEIGKGYITYRAFSTHNLEKIQEKIVAKAKAKGADAILVSDYYIYNPETRVNSVYRRDSIGKAQVTTGVTSISQEPSLGFSIMFLKYD